MKRTILLLAMAIGLVGCAVKADVIEACGKGCAQRGVHHVDHWNCMCIPYGNYNK